MLSEIAGNTCVSEGERCGRSGRALAMVSQSADNARLSMLSVEGLACSTIFTLACRKVPETFASDLQSCCIAGSW